jgi:hypothetical protein
VRNRCFASSKLVPILVKCKWEGKMKEEKEVNEMLSIEIIGVLGTLFGLLVYGMARTRLARRQPEAEQKIAWEGR